MTRFAQEELIILSEEERLEEKRKSLTRVWQMAKDHTFAILTAFRGEYDLKANLKRNTGLKAMIRKAGFGFWELEGHWIENEGTPEEVEVKENSLFVSSSFAGKGEDKKLIEFVLKAIRKYNQDAAAIKLSIEDKNAYVIDKSGRKQKIGKFSPNKAGIVYSKMRGKDDQTFKFEGAHSMGWGGALLYNAQNIPF